MDSWIGKLKELISRNKYVFAVILVGLFLMLLPDAKNASPAEPVTETPESTDLSRELEQILAQIQGVGKVRVLLTVAKGERTLYATDQDSSSAGENESLRQETVIVTDSDRVQRGLALQVIPPVYLGAVIVCQGGDSPKVCLDVVEAVCNATGLTADKISVLKMK